MKIYIAAFYQTRKAQAVAGTAFAKAAALADPAYNLESFHYLDKLRQIPDLVREDKRKIFLDSGAYSMYTQGATVDLKAYARYIYLNRDIIETASNLDAIGTPGANKKLSEETAQHSYDNQKKLESWLKPQGLAVQPVHHVRDPDHWLQRYIDEGYDYIFLGGMVPETTPVLMKWLKHVWRNYLTDKDGYPKVKVHGFGLTTSSLMFEFPWYSVDSTSWVMTSMFGACYVDATLSDGTKRDFKVDFSSRSKKQEDDDSWHFARLQPDQQDSVMQRLEELEAARVKHPEIEAALEEATGFKQGYNPTALAESYGWRDNLNIGYFRRIQDRAVKTFKDPQIGLLV
jgi:uncharacterized protein Usg